MTKKRRIQPIAVDDDAEPDVATLPVPAFSAQPTDSTRIVDPPEEGRRIWVSLDEGYDFNYKKLLQSKGVKLTFRAKDAAGIQVMPGMPSMPGFSTPIAEGKQGEQGGDPYLLCFSLTSRAIRSVCTPGSCVGTLQLWQSLDCELLHVHDTHAYRQSDAKSNEAHRKTRAARAYGCSDRQCRSRQR